jgi:hypothetical protein
MSLVRKIKALMMKPLILAGLMAVTVIPVSDAHAQTSTNGFCKYEQTTETITAPRYVLDVNGNKTYYTVQLPDGTTESRPFQLPAGTTDIEKLKVTIDHSKIQLMGGIINVSSAESCPLPGRSYAGLGADGGVGVISNDYLFSGVICVVQAIISESMLKVYCSILFWAKSAIDSAMVIYIMLYGLAIMFDLGNNPVRNAMKNFLKVTIIYLLATNATMAYNWLYKSFVTVITGFTEILTRDMIYDDTGQLVQDSDGKLFLKDGRKYNPAPTEGTDADKAYVKNPFNIRIPKQQYYFVPDSSNPATGEFKPVFEAESQCAYLLRKYTYLRANYPAEHPDLKWAATQEPITDAQISAGKLGNCDVKIVKIDEPEYKAKRYFKDGTISGDGCDPKVDINKCARPFNGIIGKFDSMFKNIVGDRGVKGLMGLAGALAGVTAGGGMVLSVILVSGIMAMFFAFFNMIFTFVSSLMGVTFMFMLAPVFIPFALFTPTFDYFKRWLSTVISFAMQPILVLAFLMVLGQVSSVNRLAEVNKTVADGKVSKEIGGINIEAIVPLFQAPEFRIPMGERSHPHFRKAANPTEDDVGVVVSLESLKAWREAKLNYVKLRYVLEKWGHGQIAANTLFKYAPQVTVEDKNNTSVYIPPLTMVDFWDANGARIKKPNSTDANDVIESTKLVGTRYVPYRMLMQKKLQDNTDDDKFMTDIGKSGGLAAVLASGQHNDFKTLYEMEISKKIFCDDGACPVDPDTNTAPTQVNLCVRNCPETAQGKQIDIFTTDQAIIDSCAKNCLYLQGGAEKFMNERNSDVLLFIILTIATASFISLIPGLCKKLSHWSPGAGAAQGQMSAAALFGGSKRHLAAGEYSNKESGEMFHPGSLLDTGLDGGRQGAVIATADKVLSTLSGGAMKNPIGTLLEGGIKGLESQMQSNTANYVEGKMNQAFANGTFEGVTNEVGKKMVEIAQKQGESGQMVYKELLQKEMAEGMYTDRDRVSIDVQQALQEMAEKQIEKEKAAAADKNKPE